MRFARLLPRLARRPAPAWPDEELPSVYLPACAEPPVPHPEPEQDWCTWPDELVVPPALAAERL
ncbi:hypothetical protein ACFXDE_28645 [Kitasatospora sp. NPDC059408]|uniref:hypothetical protein n=1 Tax=Kitasatospora sp. NPDC059408 TaxID=3346823 RepID=UPI0036D14EDF